MKKTPGKGISVFQVVYLVHVGVPKDLMLHVSYIPMEKNIFFPTFRKNFKVLVFFLILRFYSEKINYWQFLNLSQKRKQVSISGRNSDSHLLY